MLIHRAAQTTKHFPGIDPDSHNVTAAAIAQSGHTAEQISVEWMNKMMKRGTVGPSKVWTLPQDTEDANSM